MVRRHMRPTMPPLKVLLRSLGTGHRAKLPAAPALPMQAGARNTMAARISVTRHGHSHDAGVRVLLQRVLGPSTYDTSTCSRCTAVTLQYYAAVCTGL